jgi:hypothetical protein
MSHQSSVMNPLYHPSGERSRQTLLWIATKRFGASPAPTSLALVQDFLNTRSSNHGPDLLGDAASAGAWSASVLRAWSSHSAVDVPQLALSHDDASRLCQLRDELDAEMVGGWPSPSQSFTGSAEFSLGPDGVIWLPRGTGWRRFYSIILGEILLAQRTKTWPRMKLCANASCLAAFYDRSWDNRAKWHNPRLCGPVIARL